MSESEELVMRMVSDNWTICWKKISCAYLINTILYRLPQRKRDISWCYHLREYFLSVHPRSQLLNSSLQEYRKRKCQIEQKLRQTDRQTTTAACSPPCPLPARGSGPHAHRTLDFPPTLLSNFSWWNEVTNRAAASPRYNSSSSYTQLVIVAPLRTANSS